VWELSGTVGLGLGTGLLPGWADWGMNWWGWLGFGSLFVFAACSPVVGSCLLS